MNDAEFLAILNQLKDYLAMHKTFILNPMRETEFKNAVALAYELFPEAKVTIEDDPLQMGAMILCIEDFDLDVSEMKLFAEMIEKADNFEVYALEKGNVKFAAVFQNVLVRI